MRRRSEKDARRQAKTGALRRALLERLSFRRGGFPTEPGLSRGAAFQPRT